MWCLMIETDQETDAEILGVGIDQILATYTRSQIKVIEESDIPGWLRTTAATMPGTLPSFEDWDNRRGAMINKLLKLPGVTGVMLRYLNSLAT